MSGTGGSWSAAELAAVIDHTLLAATATPAQVERLCDEARTHGFAAVCVNGVHVEHCAWRLAGAAPAICAVVGFPLGAGHPEAKCAEARLALAHGARELDMVLQLGALKAGDHDLVLRDVAGVVAEAARANALVKVILETGLLEEREIVAGCRLAERAGAHFVKTSTGFGPRGATRADVELLRASVSSRIGVKAAGGIRSAALARELLAAGATRLGSSASVALVRDA